MATRKKRSYLGWLAMGILAIVAAVFHEKILGYAKQVPGVKTAVEALEKAKS